MYSDNKIWVAKSDINCYLIPKMANRHGLIAGATGTGKTITMKVIAESFSDMGVPVFFSDVKGDLSGMCTPGNDTEDMQKRINYFGIENFEYKSYPTRFWDIFGEKGTPVRCTVSDMGPQLLARLFNLTDVQAGVLSIVFRAADDQGMKILDLKDLRAMLQYVAENKEEYSTLYGNIATASVGAIQRALLTFEEEGGADVFGEPDLDIRDWIRTDANGKGYINILSSSKLIQSPLVYSTFLLWMLSELFEKLPEVGDLDKPRIVFFFDEAHMLFSDAPKAFVQKVVQVVKLIRSKGVGVYFITQSPSDIPDDVLAQLSNRVQHGLRAYTPGEQKAVRAAAEAFRVNPAFNTEEELMALGTGEALVSFLDEKGVPAVVEKARILPPQSLMGPADESKVQSIIKADEFELKYRESVDSESAYEIIMRAKEKLDADKSDDAKLEDDKKTEEEPAEEEKTEKKTSNYKKGGSGNLTESFKKSKAASTGTSIAEKAVKSAVSSATRSLATNAVNSVTGGKTKTASQIGKQAASNALSSVMRNGANSLIRGLFGNLK